MHIRFVATACSAAVVGLALILPVPASAQDTKAVTKDCTKQWSGMTKDDKKGLKKKTWISDCVAKAAPAAPTTTTTTKTTPSGDVKGKPGRQAMYARERACGKEWREAKAAGKIETGQKWPQFWSECDKRMKAQGM